MGEALPGGSIGDEEVLASRDGKRSWTGLGESVIWRKGDLLGQMDAENGNEPKSLTDSLMGGENGTTSLEVGVPSPTDSPISPASPLVEVRSPTDSPISPASREELFYPTKAQVKAARAVLESRALLEGRNVIVGDGE